MYSAAYHNIILVCKYTAIVISDDEIADDDDIEINDNEIKIKKEKTTLFYIESRFLKKLLISSYISILFFLILTQHT